MNDKESGDWWQQGWGRDGRAIGLAEAGKKAIESGAYESRSIARFVAVSGLEQSAGVPARSAASGGAGLRGGGDDCHGGGAAIGRWIEKRRHDLVGRREHFCYVEKRR